MFSIVDQTRALNRRLHIQESLPISQADAFFTTAIHRWKKGKAIYSFDPDFYKMLSDTEDTAIYVEVFQRLPHRDMFFYVPEGDTLGYIVSVDFWEDGKSVMVSCGEIRKHDEDFGILISGAQFHTFDDGELLSHAFDNAQPADVEIMGTAKTPHKDVLRGVIMACYYLAASNAELHEVKTAKAGKMHRKDGRPVTVADINAGIHYGRPVGYLKPASGEKKRNDVKEPIAQAARNPMRPHMRRAHWHHYRTGKGRTNLEVRWIAPTFIAGHGESGAVVHVVHEQDSLIPTGKPVGLYDNPE